LYGDKVVAGQEGDQKDQVPSSKGDLKDAKGSKSDLKDAKGSKSDLKDAKGSKSDLKDSGSNRIRGWFPRKCAVELADNLQADDDNIKKKESKKIK
jgi:uncharacterized protein YjbI with pentapeptide repeats